MSNFFLGFPVPRAKIADMIKGEAAPKEHAAEHKPTGTDPIVKPEDIKAGQILKWDGEKFVGIDAPAPGITIPWKDVYINQVFESLEGYYTRGVAPGDVWIDENGLNMILEAGEAGVGELRKSSSPDCPYLTWDKERAIATELWLESEEDNIVDLYIVSGDLYYVPHFGFYVHEGVLYGATGIENDRTTKELLTLGTGPYKTCLVLMAKLIPGDKVEFYVNGEKKGEITTTIPSGTAYSNNLIYFRFEHAQSVHPKRLRSTWWSFYQKL